MRPAHYGFTVINMDKNYINKTSWFLSILHFFDVKITHMNETVELFIYLLFSPVSKQMFVLDFSGVR